jgi:hypothetical protein
VLSTPKPCGNGEKGNKIFKSSLLNGPPLALLKTKIPPPVGESMMLIQFVVIGVAGLGGSASSISWSNGCNGMGVAITATAAAKKSVEHAIGRRIITFMEDTTNAHPL